MKEQTATQMTIYCRRSAATSWVCAGPPSPPPPRAGEEARGGWSSTGPRNPRGRPKVSSKNQNLGEWEAADHVLRRSRLMFVPGLTPRCSCRVCFSIRGGRGRLDAWRAPARVVAAVSRGLRLGVGGRLSAHLRRTSGTSAFAASCAKALGLPSPSIVIG